MNISVYGTGYVGLIAGTCFANIGHRVVCYDIDKEKIDKLKQGKAIFYEKDYDKLLTSALEKRKLEFTYNIQTAASFANIHLMCVGTPSGNDGAADLSHLFSAVSDLAHHVSEPFTLIIKSTVPVGTSSLIKKKISETLLARKANIAFEVVSCPEFMAQGNAVYDFMHPERIIIGADNIQTFENVKAFYAPLLRLQEVPVTPVIHMTPLSAELAKYGSNLFLATKISFMNELSRIAEATGADISEVICGMVTDPRIGPSMSRPGCGFGGSCLPKDLRALIHQAKVHDFTPSLLDSVLDVNNSQKQYFIDRLFSFFNGDVKGKIIGVWGLAFKPHTDDLRESVSCDLIDALLKKGAIVHAYDPVAGPNAQAKFQVFQNFILCKSKAEALYNADLLAVMTAWPEFYCLDTELIMNAMSQPVIFDGRGMYDPQALVPEGISYFAVGKGFLSGAAQTVQTSDEKLIF